MPPIDVKVGKAEKTTVDKKQKETIDKKEAEVDENAGREIFNIDLNTDAGCDVTDDRLRHTVNPNWLGGEGVLKEADGCSGKGAGEGAIIPMGGLMANAVANALVSFEAMPKELPLSPARVWRMAH